MEFSKRYVAGSGLLTFINKQIRNKRRKNTPVPNIMGAGFLHSKPVRAKSFQAVCANDHGCRYPNDAHYTVSGWLRLVVSRQGV